MITSLAVVSKCQRIAIWHVIIINLFNNRHMEGKFDSIFVLAH